MTTLTTKVVYLLAICTSTLMTKFWNEAHQAKQALVASQQRFREIETVQDKMLSKADSVLVRVSTDPETHVVYKTVLVYVQKKSNTKSGSSDTNFVSPLDMIYHVDTSIRINTTSIVLPPLPKKSFICLYQ